MSTPERVRPLGLAVVFGIALLARLAYLAWAPRELTSDDFFYDFYARLLEAGRGYVEADGSPGIFWMPGWPLLLAALYGVFGASASVGMAANAVMGAATAALVALLGARLFGSRTGLVAGLLYALWPGNVYFVATLMVEVAFAFALLACFLLLHRAGTRGGGPRRAWLLGVGLVFAGAAMLKAEPFALLPFLLLYLWLVRESPRGFVADAGSLMLAIALVFAPWVHRNWVAFDRLIVTNGAAGTNFWIGNRPGGSGGNDLAAEIGFRLRHERATIAETNLAQNDAGWAEAWRFALDHPGEALARVPKKLALTYGSDAAGTRYLQGSGAKQALGLAEKGGPGGASPQTVARLAALADAFWFGVLFLAAIGLVALRSAPRAAQVLVLSVPLSWLAVHALFIGGPRFHAPETPFLALLAARGAEAVAARLRTTPRSRAGAEP